MTRLLLGAHFPISLTAALLCAGVGFYSIYRSRGRPERVSLARILLLSSAWTSFSFSTSWLTDPATNTYAARALYAVAAFVPDAFCRLVLSLLPTPRPAFRWFARAVGAGSLLFVFLAFHPSFILGVQDAGRIHTVVPGPLFGFIVAYMLLGMGVGFLELVVGHKSLEGLDRNKLKYFFIGFLLAYLGAGIHFVGAYTGREPFHHDILICLYALLVFLGLWNPSRDFNELLRRFLVQVIFGAVIGVPTGVFVWSCRAGLPAAGLAFVVVTLAPAVFMKFRDPIVSFVDRFPLLRGKFVPPERVAREVMVVREARSLDEWSRRVVSAVQELFGARSASVLLRQNDMGAFLIKAGTGLSQGELGLLSLPFESPVATTLETSGKCLLSETLEANASHRSQQELSDLRFLHACVVIPLFLEKQMYALLCVGQKKSGDLYNPSDVAALSNLATSAQYALSAVLAGQAHCQGRALWAHDLIKPFGPKGALGHVARALQGEFGPLPQTAQNVLVNTVKEIDFVAGQIKNLIDGGDINTSGIKSSKASDLYSTIQEKYSEMAQKKGITWTVDSPPAVVSVHWDPDLINHRVIANLVENAFRHTLPGGKVRLGYRMEGQTFIGFVEDTGPGIRKEDLPRLFEPGTQLDPANKGLAGLGLASVKCVIESHGGRVWVESEVGKGSTFYFVMKMEL